MSERNSAWMRLAKRYWVWRLYHFIVADAVSVQRPTKYKVVRDFLGEALGIAADMGCGPGVFAKHMSARARYLLELDIDRDALARVKARHKHLERVGFVLASVDCLPLSNGSVDTVLLLEVLEHVTNDRAALGEINRILRPDGRLVFSVPVPPGEVNEDHTWGHKREGYQLPEVTALLADCGFEVEKVAFAEFKFSRRAAQTIRWWRRATRLPAPIFLSWIAYLDHCLDSRKAETGSHFPATVVVRARKKGLNEDK